MSIADCDQGALTPRSRRVPGQLTLEGDAVISVSVSGNETTIKSRHKWLLLDGDGKDTVLLAGMNCPRKTFVMEVAGGCLVKEIVFGKGIDVAMQFIIGAKLSDFTDETPSA
ncbi:MAG: hypothetical protein H6713_42220 [Myxococcales bacterium]|nr:hypothetical protein [Myxococcales bacterium]